MFTIPNRFFWTHFGKDEDGDHENRFDVQAVSQKLLEYVNVTKVPELKLEDMNKNLIRNNLYLYKRGTNVTFIKKMKNIIRMYGDKTMV